MNDDLRHWLEKSEYNLEEIPLLLAGIEPIDVSSVAIARYNKLPNANKAVVYQEVLTDEVCGIESELGRFIFGDHFEFSPNDFHCEPVPGVFMPNLYYLGWIITRDEIICWAKERGLSFPCGCNIESDKDLTKIETPIEGILDLDNDFVSEKMRVVISIWLELAEKGTGNTTPKKRALEILKERYPDMTDRENIAKIINWHTEGSFKTFPSLEDHRKKKIEN